MVKLMYEEVELQYCDITPPDPMACTHSADYRTEFGDDMPFVCVACVVSKSIEEALYPQGQTILSKLSEKYIYRIEKIRCRCLNNICAILLFDFEHFVSTPHCRRVRSFGRSAGVQDKSSSSIQILGQVGSLSVQTNLSRRRCDHYCWVKKCSPP